MERKPEKGAKKDEVKKRFVPKYEFFAKSKLRAYPDEDGVCVYCAKGEDERKFFKPATVCKSRTGQNEELCRRVGMGLALDAASVHNGLKVLAKHVGSELSEEMGKQLHKTGIPKILEAFATEKGTAFVNALAVLNVGKEGQPTEKDVKKALKVFVAYLKDDEGGLERPLARLASHSAALYLFAMTLLKDLALLQNPKQWAAKVEGQQSNAVKAWQKQPTDGKKLEKALVAELMEKVRTNKPGRDQKRKASDSSSQAARSSNARDSGGSGSSSSGTDSSTSAGKRNEATDSQAGSSEETSDLKADKRKKAKKASKKGKDRKETKKKEAEKAKQEKKDKAKKEQAKKAKKEAAEKAKKAKEDEKAVAAAERANKKKARELSLSPGDISEDEDVEEKDVYAAWPQMDRNAFARDVAEAADAHAAEKKTDKLTLAGLVSVMDNVPADVLNHHNLASALAGLKHMQKLPKKEKVQEILARLKSVATTACSGLSPQDKEDEVPALEKTPEEETEEAEAPAEAEG